MAYEIVYPWRKNPRLIGLSYYGEIEPDEINGALDSLYDLLSQAQMPLHTVFDFSEASRLPENMRDDFLQHPFKNHDKLGYCVFIEPNAYLHFIAQMLQQSHHVQIKYVSDQDDAWLFFNHMGLC